VTDSAGEIDVVIAGAGVAGSTLAILLGRAGLEVALYERHHFPREKACAEGLMPGGVGVLARLGLADGIGGAPFEGVQYHGFGLRMAAAFPAARGCPAHGLGQRRLRLDAQLFEAARRTPGVTAREGAAVEGPIIEGDRVAGLAVEGRRVRARLVVAADGPRSLLRRKAGLEGRRRGRVRLGLRAHFRLPDGAPPPRLVDVFVGEGHEIYVTPLPGREVAVAALTEDGDGNARAHFARWVRLHPALAERLDGAEQTSELAGQMPLESRARRGACPGLVLLGDAAGFVDPVTGSGMAQALLSAELLARTVVAEGRLDPSWDTLADFDRRRRALLRDTVLLTRFVLGMARRPFWARQTLRLMNASPDLYGHLVGVAGGTRTLLPG
jgi:flavin-dependent dehydrogenase